MASSSYYKRMRDQKRKEASDYKNYIDHLNKTMKSIRNDLSSYISDVNSRLGQCKNALSDGVRQVDRIPVVAEQLDQRQEKDSTTDGYLVGSHGALSTEVDRLEKLREDAEREAERYDRLYEQALEAEMQEFLSSLIPGL